LTGSEDNAEEEEKEREEEEREDEEEEKEEERQKEEEANKKEQEKKRKHQKEENKKVPGVADGVREEALREARDALSRAEVVLWPTLAESPPCRNRRLPTVELHSLSCSLSLALSLSLFPPLPLPLSRGWEHRLLLGLH
jgi:hypothetical protein